MFFFQEKFLLLLLLLPLLLPTYNIILRSILRLYYLSLMLNRFTGTQINWLFEKEEEAEEEKKCLV